MAFRVTIENRDKGTYWISLDGRLDATTAPSFEEKINPLLIPATDTIILNFEKLIYLSSAGLRIVFKIRKFLSGCKGTFIMTHLQPQIRKVFEIVNALPNTPIFQSVEEVDRYLDTMQRKEIEDQKRGTEA